MATISYTRWYREGTVSVSTNGKNVTGTDTYWLAASLKPGDLFTTNNGKSFYEIDEILDSTHITLKTAYTQSSEEGIPYAIVRNFNSSAAADIAGHAAELLDDFTRYINNDMQTINGKSAYEIAVQNGFTGTQKEWVDYLRADGEWVKANASLDKQQTELEAIQSTLDTHANAIGTLDAKTEALNYGCSLSHNSLYRGKNLGEVKNITSAEWANIRARNFAAYYLGDYWTHTNDDGSKYTFYIAGFDVPSGMEWMSLIWNTGWDCQYHSESTASTGYLLADINTVQVKKAVEILQSIWGSRLKSWELTHRFSTNGSNGGIYTWDLTKDYQFVHYAEVPSLKQVYGSNLHANSSYNMSMNGFDMLPLFRVGPDARGWITNCWLQDTNGSYAPSVYSAQGISYELTSVTKTKKLAVWFRIR